MNIPEDENLSGAFDDEREQWEAHEEFMDWLEGVDARSELEDGDYERD